MKCLTALFTLVALLAIVGCGGGGSLNSGPEHPATPGKVVEALATAMAEGDRDTLKRLVPDIEAKLGNNLYTLSANMSANIKARGGLKSVKIDSEKAQGDKAKVTATLTSVDGTTSTDTFDLIKKDGKWIVDINDAAFKAPPEEE